MDTIIYEKTHTLLMRDCDMFRRLRPSTILTMFQDCSEALTEGWGVGLDAMLARGLIWVAARAGCTVNRMPLHAETVTIRGWAGRSRSGIHPFHYSLLGQDGETLVTGCSLWVLSDPEEHSMLSGRVPKLTLPTPEPEKAPLPRFRAIHPDGPLHTTTRQVTFSETDINGHLTNHRYMDWICDLAEPSFHGSHPVTALRIDYRAEIMPCEEVPLEWSLSEEQLYCASPGRFCAVLSFGRHPQQSEIGGI